MTRVNFGGRELTVGLAHLHSRCMPAERARQMATYLESFPTDRSRGFRRRSEYYNYRAGELGR